MPGNDCKTFGKLSRGYLQTFYWYDVICTSILLILIKLIIIININLIIYLKVLIHGVGRFNQDKIRGILSTIFILTVCSYNKICSFLKFRSKQEILIVSPHLSVCLSMSKQSLNSESLCTRKL